ncbi:MAG: FecR domain-containing protein [Chitinophaga sp.]|uniref:FecR family protein n=1 Tax=Chitinophaga sp. TaxID=1869181 RepID=UPI0025B8EA8C|nr:FecR family protein [Chitinophaga sp.]MBV8255528.1 FecR domain-containing protein [Chitinophaga sp.]
MSENPFHSIQDFWADESFVDWVLGNNPVAAAHWEQWMLAHPQQVPALQEAKRLLLAVRVQEISIPEQEIRAKVDHILRQLPETHQRRIWGGWRMAAAVAGIILLGTTAWMLVNRQKATSLQSGHLDEVLATTKNVTAHPMPVTMKDGSTITLEPGANIRYTANFGAYARTVYLEGKANFDVRPLSSAPFVVNAGGIETRVLGTTFSVEASNTAKRVLIIVQHGKVAVKKNQDRELILSANQEASYEAAKGNLIKKLVSSPLTQVAVRHQEDFIFTDTPVTTIFEKLKKVYAIDLIYDPTILKSCTITANLNQEAFYDKLDLICKALGLSYQESNGQLVISGNGCGNN